MDYVLYYGSTLEKLGQLGDEAHDWLFIDNADFADFCQQLNLEQHAVRELALGMSEEDARALRGLDFDDAPVRSS